MSIEAEHRKMVRALCKDGATICYELLPGEAHAWHMATGVCGEAGELIDAIKKWVVYRKPIDLENVIEELGDLEFYTAGIRQGLGITRETVLKANMEKLAKRYEGYKYSDQRAQERKDKAEDDRSSFSQHMQSSE